MKKYYIYLDILGFDVLPKKLAAETNFEEDFIREQCFSRPTEARIKKMEEKGYNIIQGTDNWLILVNNLDSVIDFSKSSAKSYVTKPVSASF